MYGNIVLLALPVILAAAAAICENHDKKALFSVFFGVTVFFTAGIGGICGTGLPGSGDETSSFVTAAVDMIPLANVTELKFPPAFLILMKLTLMAGGDINSLALIIAVLLGIMSALLVHHSGKPPFAGAVMLFTCFIPTVFISVNSFCAALIAGLAAGFFRDRRFFRACAMIITAACFDLSVLLLIPLYIIALVPGKSMTRTLSAVMINLAAVGAAALYPDAVYGLLEEGKYTAHTLTVPAAVFASAGVLAAVLMGKMLLNTDDKSGTMLSAAAGGAAFAVTAAADGRFFTAALAALIMSGVMLAPEMVSVGRRFVSIVFPADKEKSRNVFDIVCFAAVFAIYAYLVLSGSCGTDFFTRSLFGEGSLV